MFLRPIHHEQFKDPNGRKQGPNLIHNSLRPRWLLVDSHDSLFHATSVKSRVDYLIPASRRFMACERQARKVNYDHGDDCGAGTCFPSATVSCSPVVQDCWSFCSKSNSKRDVSDMGSSNGSSIKTEDRHTQDLWLMAKHQSSDLMFRRQIGRMVCPEMLQPVIILIGKMLINVGFGYTQRMRLEEDFFVYMFLLKLWKLLASLNLTHWPQKAQKAHLELSILSWGYPKSSKSLDHFDIGNWNPSWLGDTPRFKKLLPQIMMDCEGEMSWRANDVQQGLSLDP